MGGKSKGKGRSARQSNEAVSHSTAALLACGALALLCGYMLMRAAEPTLRYGGTLSLEMIENRSAALGWPVDVDPALRHLLEPPMGGVQRCDEGIVVMSCDDLGEKPTWQKQLSDIVIRHAQGPPFENKPVMLRNCDRAMGFEPESDLSKAAIEKLSRKRGWKGGKSTDHMVLAGRNDPKIAAHGKPKEEWAGQKMTTLADAVASPFYFNALEGKLVDSVRHSARKGLRDSATWLERALGRFTLSADSIQTDTSVVVHEHSGSWLYLATGMKLWYVSPFERAPPAVAQWSLPLDSWLRKDYGGDAATESAVRSAWKPLVCMQQPGDVMVLPPFWWHATASLGSTVAFGRQQPNQYAEKPHRFPPLIRTLRNAKDPRAEMDAMWDMLASTNNASTKLLIRLGAKSEDNGLDYKRIQRAALDAYSEARSLAAAGAITARDVGSVREAVQHILPANTRFASAKKRAPPPSPPTQARQRTPKRKQEPPPPPPPPPPMPRRVKNGINYDDL